MKPGTLLKNIRLSLLIHHFRAMVQCHVNERSNVEVVDNPAVFSYGRGAVQLLSNPQDDEHRTTDGDILDLRWLTQSLQNGIVGIC